MIARLYKNFYTRVRTNCGTTDQIPILKGVKQGDISSAVLFCIIHLVILSATFEGLDYGVKIGGEEYTNAAYADDVALITKFKTEMNEILERLCVQSKLFRLSVNVATIRKTVFVKLMVFH